MGKEIKSEKALTVRAFAFGAVLAIVYTAFTTWWWCWGGVWDNILWPRPKYPGFSWTFMYISWAVFIPIFLTSLIPKRLRFSGAEIALVYSMISLLPVMLMQYGVFSSVMMMPSIVKLPTITRDYILERVSPLLGPTDPTLLSSMYTGGVAVPWSAWTTPIVYFIFQLLSCFTFFLFLGSLLRRQYVKIEMLPFPLAVYGNELINMATENKRPNLFKAKLFWIGALISFIVSFLDMTTQVAPSLPSFSPDLDLSQNLIIAGILYFSLHPPILGFAYLQPFDILLTAVIGWIVLYMVVPQVLFSMGLMTPPPVVSILRGISFNQRWDTLGTFPWGYIPLYAGIIIAVAFYPTIIHRGAFIQSLKSIFSARAEEADEPMSYRYLWIGTITFGILWLISFILIDIPIELALFSIFVIAVFQTGYSRFRAEAGGAFSAHMFEPFYHTNSWWGLISVNGGYTTSNPAGTLHFQAMSHYYMGDCHVSVANAIPMPAVLENYKIGQLTNARSRDLFIAQLVAIIIGTVVSIPILLWWFYTYGANRTFSLGLYLTEGAFQLWNRAYLTVTQDLILPDPPSITFTLPMFIIGIVLAVAMYMLRARFAWFMLTPIGLVMALTWNCGNLWTPFLVAFVLKWLTFRTGGAALYDEKGVPIAVGLITGVGFAFALGTLLFIARNMGMPLIP